MPLLATSSFDTVALVFGALLVTGAVLAGIAHRSFLSLTAVFVVAGFALGTGGLDVLDFDPRSGFVNTLATVALIVILFRDGLEVEAELLQREWRLPARALAIAMPLTAGLVAVLAKLLTDLSWSEALLLGALLSPTDPVLSSSVVTNPRVPRVIRHSLNLESGLNDGLALPAVLAFVAALDPGEKDFVWWRFVLQDVGLGLVTGVVVAAVAAYLLPRRVALGHEIGPGQKALYALGVAFATYGLAVAVVDGNGFIAVFVGAIVLGIIRPDLRECFENRSEELIEIVKLGIFVVFGSLLSFSGLFGDGWAAVAIVAATLLVVRQVAIFTSFLGSGLSTRTKAFIGWFGPKGVATMTFSLLVLSRDIGAGERIFDIAALAVFASIVVHGLTDHAGSEWIARHADERV
ncbi:MAG: sodium/hydrogen antiporter [Thermoleophilaceae bacterium]|jgi:NhaP-type Na+/H+ or K+/H+ antiporter|nr:sodium/hydrogen antiporter [Thermoleophilaceae bacterium]